ERDAHRLGQEQRAARGAVPVARGFGEPFVEALPRSVAIAGGEAISRERRMDPRQAMRAHRGAPADDEALVEQRSRLLDRAARSEEHAEPLERERLAARAPDLAKAIDRLAELLLRLGPAAALKIQHSGEVFAEGDRARRLHPLRLEERLVDRAPD